MKIHRISRFSYLFALLILAPNLLFSQWSIGQAADMVFGQSTLTTAGSGSALNQLNGSATVAVSPTTHMVFVADAENHRILRYKSYLNYTNGDAAELALTNLSTAGGFDTEGIYIDHSDNLWIADAANHRVLCLANASSLTNNTLPTKVLGQPNFTTTTYGTANNKMNTPRSVFADEARNILWVSDNNNHRILRFDNLNSLANGASADVILGTGTSGAAQNTFSAPNGLYVDANGNLWVADTNNNRVLRFDAAHNLTTGANASAVLGQADFTTGTSRATSQNSFKNPRGIYGDNGGRLYVSDFINNRIMIYKNAASLNGNANADFVIGQSSFTTNSQATTASGLKYPNSIFVDDYLWVADYLNNRVLRYAPLSTLPVSLLSFSAKTENAGNITLAWETASEANSSHFDIQISEDGKTFVKVAEIASKAENGNSSALLKYSYTLDMNGATALTGLSGLLTLLLLPTVRNRMMKALMAILVLSAFIGCQKDENAQKKTVYVKLIQVDKDGATTELGIKSVKVNMGN